MGYTDSAKDDALDGIGSAATWISLHTADPSTSGANELTGGSPAYARKQATWGSAASSAKAATNQPVFDVGAGKTITHWGLWTASTSGTFKFGGALPASETFGAQGTYTATSITLSATG